MPGPFPDIFPGDSAARAVRRWATGTFAGRALLVGAVVKLLAWVLRALVPSAAETVDTAGDLALVVGAVVLAYRLLSDARGALLWRVRSKLTLSYIFIGFVPVLLVIVLFLTSGALLFFNVSHYVVTRGINTLVEQAGFLAESAVVGLQGSTAAELLDRLERRQAGAVKTFPDVSYAIVPASRACEAAPEVEPTPAPGEVVTAGPWTHLPPPDAVPGWVPCAGTADLITYTAGESGGRAYIAARAVAWPDEPRPQFAVLVDVPFGAFQSERLRAETGVDPGDVTPGLECAGARPLVGLTPGGPRTRPRGDGPGALSNPLTRPLNWVAFLQYVDWSTGMRCGATMSIDMTLASVYARIAATPGAPRNRDLGALLLFMVAVVGVLFLVIQIAAFVMGLALARSITGAVHELFVGTERVRRGEFTHKIPIHSQDQLGELAVSFNSMTSSIEDLLQQKAEKERLEQELRIARNIQMSLLPQGGLRIDGLSLDAHCEPAREVGGDYYDYLPIDDHRVGLLIADVAGKGTSAALYMAELKGLMLSLSQLHTSPRRLLIDANRIISRHLDSRSFITITYAVVDLRARTLTYARAGHTPLIYVPGPEAPSRAAQILAPDGLVLGLQIDDGQHFERLLTEATLAVGPGDLFLFYTDGLTEAMDVDGNCFGDARLSALLREHADLPFEELRERILREIAAFSGSADQHDDMTMLLLKIEKESQPGRVTAFTSASDVRLRA